MFISLLSLIVIGAFAFYVMSPRERERVVRPIGHARRLVAGLMPVAIAAGQWLVRSLVGKNPWTVAGVGAAALAVLAIVSQTMAVRPLPDVRPEIERTIAVETRTAGSYGAAVKQFTLGAVTSTELVRVIEISVVPELQSAAARMRELERMPPAHHALVVKAEQYLALRERSWRLRADALRKRSTAALRTADEAERVSLDVFEDLKRMRQALAT